MTLSQGQIVDAAYATLCRQGLGGLSMRHLAQDLGVQHGALYYHVASKQELLVAVAGRLLADGLGDGMAPDAMQAAGQIRDALLRVRDSAEVVSFARAYQPAALAPLGDLYLLFAGQLPDRQARWAAKTLIHYVLGFVAEEQNRDELVRAKILNGAPDRAEARVAFEFGVSVILRGLQAAPTSQA